MADRSFLEWPFFDDHHRRLAEELDAWCAANLTGEHGADVDEACRALVRQLGEAGWLRYCVPAAYGGIHERLDVRSLAIIRETLARHDGLADFVFAMQGLGSGTISLFGNEEQKSFYLPSVAAGREIAAFALSEPRSDAAGSVAAELGFVAVSVEEAKEEGAIGAAFEELDAVGADPGVALAELASDFVVPADGFALLDDEEVVAAGVGFDEGEGAHSASASWKETTWSVASLARSSASTFSCMRRVATSEKQIRSRPAILSRSRICRR